MNVTLTALHETESCTWCERSKECVTATFDDGFIQGAPLCWACLKNAVKVQNRKSIQQKSKDPSQKEA